MAANARKTNYFTERDRKNQSKLFEIIDKDLPFFCREYFIGIENNTAVLTRLNYAYDLRVFFKYLMTERSPFTGKDTQAIKLADLSLLSSYDIENFLSHLSYYEDTQGNIVTNKDKGKARKLSSVRAMLRFFLKKEKIDKDPTLAVKTPKIYEKEIIRLEKDEIPDILDKAESGQGLSRHQIAYHDNTKIRDTAIVGLLLGTGIRVSELVGLDLTDVDFQNASFVVTRKGGNRVMLYFNEEIGGMLYDYYMLRTGIAKQGIKDEKAFFLSLQNKRISVKAVQNLVKKYSQLVNPLKKISPHKLRSTYGTELYRQTGDIYIVADVLGHKDVNTTKKHYAAISDEQRKKASTKVNLRSNSADSDINENKLN